MKKAFTLVELLGVIIILGVLALITFPIIDKSIKNSKEKALERAIDNIEEAAYNYSIKNDLGYETFYNKLSLEELKKSGFLEKETINPVTNENMTGCVIYKWDDSKKQYEFKYEDPCPSYPDIPASLISILLEQYSEGNSTGLVKDSENENLYYYTGTNEEVSNNFLWYGGHQWRVLEFDTEANTLTLITQQPLTAIQPSSAVWDTKEEYESSYINQWLNDYFWNSLDSSIQNNILDSTFNVGIYTDVDEITTVQKVGLLDQVQYERSGSTDSFLNIKNWFWLGNRYSSSGVQIVNNVGKFSSNSPFNASGVRIVVKIRDLIIVDGDGTLVSSYRTANKSADINEAQVGEYINVPYSGSDNACGNDNMCTFRVVSKDSNSIKVVLNGLLSTTSAWATDAADNLTTSDLIYTNVLNGFIENIDSKYITTGTYGVGMYASGNSYTEPQKATITANIGLPTVGEIFSGNDIDMGNTKTFVDVNTIENPIVSNYYWTMNRYSSSDVRRVDSYSYLYYKSPSSSYGVRPVIYLKSGLSFTGGEGTAQSPYSLQ